MEKCAHSVRARQEVRTPNRECAKEIFTQRMTSQKLKYQFFPWLLHTQYVEVCSAETDSERAKELCDIIAASIQWLRDMGFDPETVFFRRVDEKFDVFHAILRKYDEKFQTVIEQAKELE